jgi:ribosomal protein S18 acetylase RimI-like enzyme
VTFEITELSEKHDVQAFTCGNARLDNFLKRDARDHMSLHVAKTFVAVEQGKDRVCGYHAVCTGAVRFAKVPDPEFLKRQNLHYPVPTMHLARLAVDTAHRGFRLGEALLFHALGCAVRASREIAIAVIDVLAIDDSAKAFYLKYGFTPLVNEKQHLFLPIKTAQEVYEAMLGTKRTSS